MEHPNKIIAAGHICLDITPVFPSDRSYSSLSELLVPGKLFRMAGADVHTGGSVANTGLALKILGNDVRLLGKIGNDAFGALIQSIFAEYGAGGLLVDDSCSTSYSIVLAPPGMDRTFLHDPAANDTFVSSDIPEEAFEDCCLLHFGYPSVMKRMLEEEGRELVSLYKRAKSHGLATSLDLCSIDPASDAARTNWRAFFEHVLPHVDFFLPSFEEICFMLDPDRFRRLEKEGGDMTEALDLEKEAMPLAEQLLELGCAAAVIKCGKSGMLYKTAGAQRLSMVGGRISLDAAAWADRAGIQPCFKAESFCSATGAGDTSIAAFLTAMLAGKAPGECTALAAAEGACCVTAYDALSGLKALAELEARVGHWDSSS